MIEQTEADFLNGLGQSLTYRFIKDSRGWRIIVSTTLTKTLPVKDTSKGVIGIDFNDGFVSVAHINENGQKVSVFDLSYDTGLEATSRHNKTKMQEISVTIRDYARGAKLPIAIEDLDFKRTKGALQKQDNHRYSQMISALSYGIFKQAMAMQCFKYDIALIQVNPAFTSVIGRLKYGRETKFNTHQAAAWVIARRAMGLKERLPKQSMIRCSKKVFDVFTAPVDALKTQQQRLILTSKAFNQWIITTIKAERLRVKNLSKFIAPLDDSILDF
jgi:IS605 OrfB family transposase